MKKLSQIILILCMGIFCHAQTDLTGTVNDSLQKPIAGAVISLLSGVDSTLRMTTISDNTGNYKFERVAKGVYIISASYQGYIKIFSKKIEVSTEQTVNIEGFLLIPFTKELQNITVVSRKPVFENRDDRIVFNVSEDPSLKGQAAIDVLRKTPFVGVDGNGNILINGKSSFLIQLNGRSTNLFSNNPKAALEGFPSDLIHRVEVITIPSGKYDAEGASGIINIITKNRIIGYNCSIGISYKSINVSNANITLNAKKGKLGFSMSLSEIYRHNERKAFSDYRVSNPVSPFAQRTVNKLSDLAANFYYGDAELSWDADSLNTISLYISGSDGNNKVNDSSNIVQFDATNSILSQSIFLSQGRINYPSVSFGSDYIKKFRSNKEKELSIKFNRQFSNNKNYIDESQYNSNNPNRFIINSSIAKSIQDVLQADFVLPFSKNKKIEIGAKLIQRNASSDYKGLLKDQASGAYIIDSTNSDIFNYGQRIMSLYAVYGIKFSKFSLSTGLRFEHTKISGDFISSSARVSQKYANLFPSITLVKVLPKFRQLVFSYNRKLARPGIVFLNPFIFNIDPFNISQGNSQLDPELISNFSIRFNSFRKGININVELGQTFGKKGIVSVTSFEEQTAVSTTSYFNAGKGSTTYLSGFVSFSFFKKIRFSTNINLYFRVLRNMHVPGSQNKGLGGMSFVNLSYTHSSRLSFYSFGNIFLPGITIQGRPGNSYSYNIGTSYKLAKNKLSVGCSIESFLNRYVVSKGSLETGSFSQIRKDYAPARGILISLRYNFGKLKENTSRKKGVTVDDLKAAD